MAILQNLAGQYAKDRSNDEFKRFMWLGFLVVLIGGILSGIALSISVLQNSRVLRFAMQHQWGFIGAIAITVPLYFWFMTKIERIADTRLKDRIKWLRGGHAEAYIAWLLMDLSHDWHVFNNIMLRENWDADHVVVGPRGLFCISTKSQRGLYSLGDDGSIQFNGERTDFVDEAVQMSLKLKDRLEAISGRNVTWVQPVLAVPLAHVGFETQSQKAWVVHEDNISDTLERSNRRLSKSEIEQLVTVLKGLVSTTPIQNQSAMIIKEG